MSDNEFINLPDDPDEAFGVLEKSLRSAVMDKGSQAQKYDNIRTLSLFADIYNIKGIDYRRWLSLLEHENIVMVYDDFQKIASHIGTKNTIEAAKVYKETSYRLLKFDDKRKSEIRLLIGKLKTEIDNMHIDTRRRESLMSKLNAFATEVDRERTRTEAFFAFAAEASRVVKEVSDNIKPFENTLDRLSDIVDGAANKITAALPWTEPKQIEGPKPSLPKPQDTSE